MQLQVIDAGKCTDCRSEQLLDDDLNSLKVASQAYPQQVFSGALGRRFMGHNSFMGARAHPAP